MCCRDEKKKDNKKEKRKKRKEKQEAFLFVTILITRQAEVNHKTKRS
jgi:hypothetical protein